MIDEMKKAAQQAAKGADTPKVHAITITKRQNTMLSKAETDDDWAGCLSDITGIRPKWIAENLAHLPRRGPDRHTDKTWHGETIDRLLNEARKDQKEILVFLRVKEGKPGTCDGSGEYVEHLA